MGRVREKLLSLLEAEGFSAIEIAPAMGHYRSSPYADVHRWDGSAIKAGDHVLSTVYSWDTMTACVKYGIEVSERDKGSSGIGYEIYRRTP